jgi:enterochelin esterase-like enzyme
MPLRDRRRLWVYTPAVTTSAPLPVLVVFDGRLYKDQLYLPQILDYWINLGRIPPLLALMVDSRDRSELQCRHDYAAYIAGEVMPWLRSHYATTVDPCQTVVLGSSYGGLAAAFLANRFPALFGLVFAQSGWFRWRPEGDSEHHWLARQFAVTPRRSVAFWLQVGNLEVAQMADGGPSQLEANRTLHATLVAKGYAVRYCEYSGGHDASSLEYPLAQGLLELFSQRL